MGAHNQGGGLREDIADGLQAGVDAGGVGDASGFERDIEVAAKKDFFVAQGEILNGRNGHREYLTKFSAKLLAKFIRAMNRHEAERGRRHG
jgi:hypothetical protein